MKKGFTLVELLAVLVILSLILVIAVPSVNKYLRQSKEKAYDVQLNTVISAAQTYASMNPGLLPSIEGVTVKVTLGQLKTSGLIKDEFKNPNSDKYFDDSLTVEITKNGENYRYNIVESTIIERTGEHSPKITLNGNPIVYYKLNKTYTELGASAVDYNNNPLLDITIDSSNVNTSVEGIYQVKYTVTDTLGVSTTVYRNVEVSKSTSDLYTNGTTIYFNPNENKVCSESLAKSNTSKNNGCLKWYIFLSNETDKVNLILAHNSGANVAWNGNGTNSEPVDVLTELNSNISSWNSAVKVTARLISAKELAKIIGNTTWTTSDSTLNFYTNTSTAYQGEAGTNKYAWLFDYTKGCLTKGCSIEDATTNGYWTSDRNPSNNYYAWCVNPSGSLVARSSNEPPLNYGVRPVITVSKSILR